MSDLEITLKQALRLPDVPSFDGDLDEYPTRVKPRRHAAVLILVNTFGKEPSITLTQRTKALREHSGQVAFPGGRVDENDASPWLAALRETHEEIGMPLAHPLIPIGAMDKHFTITGYEVEPFVAINELAFDLQPEEGEVAEIFDIPLALVKPENFKVDEVDWQNRSRRFYVLPFQGYYIWGATARMLYQFGVRLQNV